MNPSPSLWQRLTRATTPLALTQTLTYYAAFIALGLTTASLGPTLLGLADQTGSTIKEISVLFTVRALGYLTGSLLGGRLFDRLPGHRTIAAATLLACLLLASVPEIPMLWLLAGIMLIIGVMEALIDVGANTLIVWVHRDRVAPYMNGLHLFFAVGAFLAPILVAQAILLTGNFRWAYWLLALLFVPIVIRLFPLQSPPPLVSHQDHVHVRPDLLLLILIAAFFFTISSAEGSFGGWVFTYGVKTNLMSEETAAYVNAAFWGAFMLSRVASIPLGVRVRPRVVLAGDLALSLAGIGAMTLFPTSSAAMWIGTILFGLGIASAFPTILTFAGRHMTITGAVTSWFFVGASIGGMTIPWLIGQLFEQVSPQSVLWVIGTDLLVGSLVFILILLRVRKNRGTASQAA